MCALSTKPHTISQRTQPTQMWWRAGALLLASKLWASGKSFGDAFTTLSVPVWVVLGFFALSWVLARFPIWRKEKMSPTLEECVLYAHRGGRDSTLENSLDSFRNGAEHLGGLELDVWLTKCGEVLDLLPRLSASFLILDSVGGRVPRRYVGPHVRRRRARERLAPSRAASSSHPYTWQ